mmetsp:Transcript_650/g.703  ORF Transcript_650/g.703 Transcript_650/m.703 type:complete len:82 (-) Transcript_650:98-343(-)
MNSNKLFDHYINHSFRDADKFQIMVTEKVEAGYYYFLYLISKLIQRLGKLDLLGGFETRGNYFIAPGLTKKKRESDKILFF